MLKKYEVDALNTDSVSVKTQLYTVVSGVEYAIGQPHRKSYVNSTSGRREVQSELQQAQQDAIFAIWGGVPTINER